MLWPTDDRLYNRHYLRFVPRDRYDELVWSIDDSDIREGNFDRNEWNFALRKEVALSCAFLNRVSFLMDNAFPRAS